MRGGGERSRDCERGEGYIMGRGAGRDRVLAGPTVNPHTRSG